MAFQYSSSGFIMSTTNYIEGHSVDGYLGIVVGEAIIGANILRDLFAGIRDIVGGRARGYEESLNYAREIAMNEMKAKALRIGANAVIGIDIEYENIRGGMLMVCVNGTAVKLVRK